MAKTYVDGFVMVIPKKNKAAYMKMAKEAATVWVEYGALSYKECRADDMNPEHAVRTFLKLAKPKEDEEVWFSFIVFASKAERNKINKKVMAYFDEKYADMKNFVMPFDPKKSTYGGFVVEVEA